MDNNLILDLQTLARALGGEVRNGQVAAPGPNHGKADRSLSVRPDPAAPDGFVVHSFADDDPIQCRDYVREKVGLSPWKPGGNGHVPHKTEAEIEKSVLAAIKRQSADGGSKSNVVARFGYTDEQGTLLYQVEKLEPKRFRQRRPDGKGDWIWKLDDVRRVVYRWPELLKYPDATVFVAEGEKDADRVASLGHCATTVAGGKWTDECVKALAGRDCLILEDNDEAGRKKAHEAATALHGTAKTVRIVRLPGLPEKGDVSDWLDADPNRGGKLVDICFDAPVWTPETASTVATTKDEAATEPPPLDFIDLTAWEGQPIPERQWAVLDRVPDGEVTLFSGEGAIGKSLIFKQLAVATVAAKGWLGAMPASGPVIYLTAEEKVDELHHRLHHIIEHTTSASLTSAICTSGP